MNIASAGPVIAVWLLRDPQQWEYGARLLRRSIAGLVAGSVLGGALLLLPYAGMHAALARFPLDAYVYAGVELLFSAAAMGAVLWLVRGRRPAGWLAIGLGAAGALNLLYHFPPLMAVLGELAVDSNWATAETIDRRTLLELWQRPEVLALWAHFVAASFAVAALAAVWPAAQPAPDDQGRQRRCVRRMGLVALAASVAQLPIGVALLATDGAPAREAMLGQHLPATLAFGASMLAGFALLQALASLAWGEGPRVLNRAGWLLVAVVTLMAATLRLSRDATNQGGDTASPPWKQRSSSPSEPQAAELIARRSRPRAPFATLPAGRREACSA